MHPHRADAAVRVGGQLDVLDHPASVRGRERVLRAVLVPAHDAAEPAGQGEAERLLGVHVELRPEAAADGRRHHAELVLREAGDDGQHDLEDVRDLCRRVDGEVAAVRFGDDAHAPRLHRHRDETLLYVPLAHDVRRVRERSVDRGGVGRELPGVAAVTGEVGVGERDVGLGVREVEDRGEVFVVDHDRLGRVARGFTTRRDDDRDPVAGEAHLAQGERPVRRVHHVGGHGPCAGQGRREVVGEVGAGQDRDDTGSRRRLGGVDRTDARVRGRAAHDLEVQRPGHGQVVDVAGGAGQDRGVLSAEQPGPDHRGHVAAPPLRMPMSLPAAASTAFTMLW